MIDRLISKLLQLQHHTVHFRALIGIKGDLI